jgi:8-oxo-dGDP phosphatase
MLADALGRRPVLGRERLFEGRIWDVERQEFELGGDRILREVIVHPGAVAVVAMNDADEIMLVHQYRHPAGGTLWELPAGLLDVHGEDPLEAAKRELAEEVDLAASTWQTLLDISTTGGGSTEIIRVYLATGIRSVPDAFAREHEEAEMEARWVPLAEAVDAALAMRLHNATLLAALLAVTQLRARGDERSGLQAHPADAPFDWHDAHRA